MEKCIIVAIADNNAIGKDNSLLWHISEDLKFFKRTTMGCPVIMGRRTFESIGRPLPERLNIIISRSGFVAPDGVLVASSLEDAFAVTLRASSEKYVDDSPARCFIIGGGQIYAQAIDIADRLIVTHVHTEIPDADTFFPKIDVSRWTVANRSQLMNDPKTGYDFEFVEYIPTNLTK